MATITSPRASSPAVLTSLPSPSLPSTTNTPTSSHRPSIDLPPQPNTNPQTSQRRNRAALRDYYNLKAKNPATGPSTSTPTLTRTSSITSTTSTATADTVPGSGSTGLPAAALDDPTFDPESYVATLLRSSSLRDVLRAESQLVSEIRNLDGERKALVYDNYSKLIKAVGTIAEMQRGMVKGAGGVGMVGVDKNEENALDGVEGLEGRIDGLMGMFRSERGVVGESTEAKGERQKRRKVEMVKWVVRAEERLRGLIERGQREEAEEEWKKVRGALDRWEGVGGVKEVREACERVMAGGSAENGDDESDKDEKDMKSDDGD